MTAHRAVLAAALALAGCATGAARTKPATLPPPAHQSRAGASTRSAGPAPVSRPPPPSPEVARAVDTAAALVGSRTIVVDGVDYGSGCAALVRAAFVRAGRALPADARDAPAVMAVAERRGALSHSRRAAAGDLVFLSDRPGGPVAHVGLVARVEPDGTLVVLHRVARGVRRVRVNLAYPDRAVDPSTGRHINDTLLVRSQAMSAGSLVVGVSDLLRRG
jgi:hypothetical protein